MRHKSMLMREVEAKWKQPIDVILVDGYNEYGLPALADRLGINKATLWYWYMALHIRFERYALRENEVIIVRHKS